MTTPVTIIGGGLAGCEAAWQLSRARVPVRLYDMKPQRFSPAHSSDQLAELVCSNSLRSDSPSSAIGLLHEELRRMGSLVLEAADAHRLPAGQALAVDRSAFSRHVTERIEGASGVELVREEVTRLPEEGIVIVATGPLTSEALSERVGELCGDALYFYDSIAPTVYFDSLDLEKMYRASRWEAPSATGEEEGDYLNIPLSREQYESFVRELVLADKVPLPDFEAPQYFEGCLPVEVMAERGSETLAFGPMKPVGLDHPRTGKRAHAVVQLRQEDERGTLWGMVGFQTRMRVGEQKRILRQLPGMEKAVFARFGSLHRNTFIRAPALLDARLALRERPDVYFAGQIAGVEGYVESAALGLLAGVHTAFRSVGREAPLPPDTTALGALLRHLGQARADRFQPMNVNFGLFPPLVTGEKRVPKKQRNEQMSGRALADQGPYVAAVKEVCA